MMERRLNLPRSVGIWNSGVTLFPLALANCNGVLPFASLASIFILRHSCLCVSLYLSFPCICHCICLFYLYYDFHEIFPKFSMASTHSHKVHCWRRQNAKRVMGVHSWSLMSLRIPSSFSFWTMMWCKNSYAAWWLLGKPSWGVGGILRSSLDVQIFVPWNNCNWMWILSIFSLFELVETNFTEATLNWPWKSKTEILLQT